MPSKIARIGSILLELYLAAFAWLPSQVGIYARRLGYGFMFRKAGRFSIHSGVTIEGIGNIELGNRVSFFRNCYLYAHERGQLVVGSNFSMNHHSILAASGGRIVIGDNCMIGPNCVLRAANHAYERIDIPMREQGHTFGEIILEDDVWLGSNCVITANTRIGKGSIVAAGSVVTRDVEPYSIVGGVPARKIRSRLSGEKT